MKHKIDKSTVAILAVCLIAYAQNATGSIIQTVTNAFEVTPAMGRMIATLPALTTVFTALLSGFIAGRILRYRTMYAMTCLFWTVGGVMPIFLHSSFIQILISRLIYGLGTGFGMSTGMYFVNAYPPETQAKMVGIGTAFSNVGSLLFLVLGGALGELGWMYPFYLYFACAVAMVLVMLFLREPESAAVEQETAATAEETPTPFSGKLLLFPLTTFIIGIALGAFNSGMSTIVAQRGLGASFVTSVILCTATVGGVLTGTMLEKIQNRFGRFAVAVMLGVLVVSFMLIIYSRSVLGLCVASFLNGMGYFAIKPLFTLYIRGEFTGKTASIATMSLFAMTNLGTFLTNYWISASNAIVPFFSSELEKAFFTGALAHLLLFVVFLVYNPMKKKSAARKTGSAGNLSPAGDRGV